MELKVNSKDGLNYHKIEGQCHAHKAITLGKDNDISE